MFDVGFSELLVIAIVALIVIGPERLPKVARTLGHLLGRAQRYVNEIKADINREMQLDELKKLQSDVQDSMHNLETSLRGEAQRIEETLEQSVQPVKEQINGMPKELVGQNNHIQIETPQCHSPHTGESQTEDSETKQQESGL